MQKDERKVQENEKKWKISAKSARILKVSAVLDPLATLYLKDSAALERLSKDSAVSDPLTAKDSAVLKPLNQR